MSNLMGICLTAIALGGCLDGAGTPGPDGGAAVDPGPPGDPSQPGDPSHPGDPSDPSSPGAPLDGGPGDLANAPSVDGAAPPASDPLGHTQAQVCSMYASSGAVSANFFSKSATTCDAGTVTAAGIANAVARINYHRWLVGLAGVTDQASSDGYAQKCALVSAWNPAGPQAHMPPPSAECYTADGATGAGSSNIAWGCQNPVAAIDQWIDDQGNATTMGHRRWILNPPLDPVGFGIYLGGDAGYGSAACLQVFGQSGTGPRPTFVAYPPGGYVPVALAKTTWTFAGDGFDFTAPTVTVTRLSDNAALAVTLQPVQNPGGFNYPDATSWVPSGWTPTAGETYRVHVVAGAKNATYDVKPVSCP